MKLSEDQIKHMRDRFLSWELPRDLNPDGGITYERSESAIKYNHPGPVGTNFLNADQAEAMVRHMVVGMPNEHDKPARDPRPFGIWDAINALTGWLFVGAFLKMLVVVEGKGMAMAVGFMLILLVVWRLHATE